MLILALLAHPLVSVLLGSQWLGAAPLMQILAVALMFAFPIVLHYATVVSVGAIRYMPATSLFDRSIPPIRIARNQVIDFSQRPIWLVRGQDRAGNDFAVGKPEEIVARI